MKRWKLDIGWRGMVMIALVVLLSLGAAGRLHAETPGEPEAVEAPAHPHLKLGDVEGSERWPLQLHLPAKVEQKLKEQSERSHSRYLNQKQRGTMSILVWQPAQAKRIRAVLIIPQLAHSMAFGEYRATREVATRQGMGIIYLRHGTNHELIQDILDAIAQRTGVAEYRHAPWIVWGMSAQGRFPAKMTWAQPQRTIASISWHGEVPPWHGNENYPPPWAKFGQTHLHLSVNGETEWAGTWHRHVRPGLLNYGLHKGWLTNQVVAPGVGHGDHPEGSLGQRHGYTVDATEDDPVRRMSRFVGFDYAAMFCDRALTLRLPEEGYPTDRPLTLRQVDETAGYCIHPRALEYLLGEPWRPLEVREDGQYRMDPAGRADARQDTGELDHPLIRPASALTAEQRRHMFWVPDREMAQAWWKIHAVKDQPFVAADDSD